MNRIALIIALILLSSCVSKYQDISSNLGYSHLLNTSYATKEEMYISGVNMPPGYGKDIDVYIIGPTNPSWDGPEVITRDILKKGTTLTIQSVKKCTNCFEKRVEAIVTIDQQVNNVDVPIQINLRFVDPKFLNEI